LSAAEVSRRRGDRISGWLRRHWLWVAIAAGIAATWLPLLMTRVLPFHDASGIIGLGGALNHRDNPAARIHEFYQLDIRAYPSALYFGWLWLLGNLGIGAEPAVSLFIALFVLAGPPLALMLVLHSFGRPLWLALLVFPVSYHHQVWFGFLGSSAAITGLLLAVAFARRVVERASPGNAAGLAAAILFVAAAHPFSLALTLMVIAPLLLWPPSGGRNWRRWLRSYGLRALALVPSVLFLSSWFAGFFTQRTGGRSLLTKISVELRLSAPKLGDGPRFVDWLGNGYRADWDEAVPLLALVTLVVFLVLGARAAPARGADPTAAAAPARNWRDRDWLTIVGLGWPVLSLALGYLTLPMQLMWPEHWWGVRVRCVAPCFVLAIALIRPRRRGLPITALTPAVLAGVLFLGYVAYDFRSYFRNQVLAGFDETIALIPPGQSVLGFPVLPDRHYTEGHPYLVQHYVARKGGRAVPQLKGHPGSYWITMKAPPPSPAWGDPRQFVWDEHAAGFDFFLMEMPVGRSPFDPMRDAPRERVGSVAVNGQWLLWHRR
jgi:hypothetical protein